MEIDPLYFLQPILSLGITGAVCFYWWRKQGFRGIVLLLSFGAYWLAILLKAVVNTVTASPVAQAVGSYGVVFGLYQGIQTVVFEVGLAYLFAAYGAKKFGLAKRDGVPYGLGLAFWENGVYIAVLASVQLLVIYAALMGNASASSFYSQLQSNSPALFYGPAQALTLVAYSAMERTSSLMAHAAWGMLTVYAAVSGRKVFLAIALPMGLLDTLTTLQISLAIFEPLVFIVSFAFLLIALVSSRSAGDAKSGQPPSTTPGPPATSSG